MNFGVNNKYIFVSKVFFTLIFILTVATPNISHGASASMFLSPTTSSYTVGNNFSVVVKVNTGGSAINAAEGKVVFDTNKLTLRSISKSGSIFSLWTTEPGETSPGNIEFGGGIPNPGYTGSSGTIITLNFRANEPGNTTVSFVSGAVLANDGLGTNILSTLGGGSYSLNPGSIIPTPTQTTDDTPLTSGVPQAPKIISSTHPNSDMWYSKSTAEFEWSNPADVTAVRLLVGKIANATPNVLYQPPVEKKTVAELEDGVWYFHVRLKNGSGWGETAHFPVRVDTTAPKQFEIKLVNSIPPTLNFETVDATSGVAQYEIQIDGGESLFLKASEISPSAYVLKGINPGDHKILVKAIDKAGNSTLSSGSIIVEGIEAPVILEYPDRISEGGQLSIKGSALSNKKIVVSIRKDGDNNKITGTTESLGDGTWRYVYVGELARGSYMVSAFAEDSRGVRSYDSNQVSFLVSPPLFLKFGKIAIDYLTTMITLIILIVVLIGGVFYLWYAVTNWKKNLRKEVGEAEDSINHAFRELYLDLQEQFDLLEDAKSKRDLTAEEKRILKRMEENLDIAEKFIKKEVRDIKKQVE
jgi:hypothetical protein